MLQREEKGHKEPRRCFELRTTKDETVPEDFLNVGVEETWREDF